MKSIIIYLLFLIVHCTFIIDNCISQWIMQNSGTNKNLRSIKFINRWTGWTVGDNSTILKTTNGGLNWFNISNPTSGKPLHMVSAIDSNNLYVVGDFSTILKSTNGGTSWIVIMNWPIGDGNSYEGVYFMNKDTGWVCGQGESGFGNVLFTRNGFNSFDSSYTLCGYQYDIYFKDISTGLVIGGGGCLFYTTNSGYNWQIPNIQLYGTLSNFFRLSFVNNFTGWIPGGGGRIYKTTDFGINWDSISYIGVPNSLLYCIKFADLNIGWSGGEDGRLYKSTNGGVTWRTENSLDQRFIRDIFMYDNMTGWCVGGGGKILYTTTGGTTDIKNNNDISANNFILYQNYPNPFNQTTTIKLQIHFITNEINSKILIRVYNILGKEVATLFNEQIRQGTYEVKFNTAGLASGIYFYNLIVEESKGLRIYSETKRMVLIK